MKAIKLLFAFVPAVPCLFVSATLSFGQPSSQSPPRMGPFPVVEQAEKHDVSPALRDIPAVPHAEPPLLREIPRQPLPRRGPKPGVLDPMIQASPGAQAMPSTSQNFESLSNNAQSAVSGFVVWPPDTNGDVGPNHYVQWVNLAFAIYNKTGTKLYGPAAGNTLWQGFGGPCATRNDGDPIVLYDHLADRWLMSQFALPNFPSGPFYQCIAVSTTPDPTGTYHRYAFLVSQNKLNDYPKFGVWPDGYYMTVNQFSPFSFFGFTWAGQGVAVFEREKMLTGASAQMVYFDLYGTDPNLGGMLPSDLDGSPPPLSTPNYFVQVDDDAWGYSPDQLQIWDFSVNWTTPSASTFIKQTALTTAPFDSNMCGYSDCITQPGTAQKLDPLSDRLMHRLQYRNFGTHASLVTNHTVDVDGFDHAGIRWYELRNNNGTWGIYQQGSYAPDSNHRWMGSIAMDGAGNIGLGFSASGGSAYPSIRYTGRLAADTPLDEMTQSEAALIAGGGSQTGAGRWGDYSMLAVDPTDDCTFWYTQEYYQATSSTGWQTRIGSFKFPSCGLAASGADLSISKGDSPDPVNTGAALTYTLTVGNAGPDSTTNVTVTDTLPVGAIYGNTSSSGWSCSQTSGTVTCTLASLAVGTAPAINIAVTAPTTGGTITNTASVNSNTNDPIGNNNTASATTTVQAPATASLTVLKPNGGESWKINSSKTIQWASSGVSGNVRIELSRNGGTSWETLFAGTPNDGSQSWKVTGTATTTARIKVTSVNDPSASDVSNGDFVIR